MADIAVKSINDGAPQWIHEVESGNEDPVAQFTGGKVTMVSLIELKFQL
jgi:hypothetical protein